MSSFVSGKILCIYCQRSMHHRCTGRLISTPKTKCACEVCPTIK